MGDLISSDRITTYPRKGTETRRSRGVRPLLRAITTYPRKGTET